jgi:formylmethanofuran dehydrogenase subunit D
LINKRSLGVMLIFTFAASLFLVAGINAGTKAPDEIQINDAFKHKKGIVTFTHKKHITEHKLACAECHHDDKGKPRTDLKEGDAVKKCFECHNKPGEVKGKAAKGLSKEEKLAYIGNAMHENCVGCHRKYNRDNKTKAAPTKCSTCHPKEKK